jgi:hypothetical protein
VAYGLDLALVHPAASVDDAWLDTVDLLWRSKEESRFRRAMFVPLAALATPIVFVTDWSFRILFPIPEREERTLTEQETKTQTKPAARQDGAQVEKQ